MTITETLGDIVRAAPTSAATVSALEVLRGLAHEGDLPSVAELAATVDA